MQRLLTVVFGPSRSKRFGKAVELAHAGPGECKEVEPGRYRVSFRLDTGADIYAGLAQLLERVRHWRATEVNEEDEQVSVFHTKEMAWCASFQLSTFGECRERFQWGVLPRCALCPLFDSERALRAGMRKEPASGKRLQAPFPRDDPALIPEPDLTVITNLDLLFDSDLMAQLDGELPESMDLSGLIPDSPPEEWPDTPPRLDADDEAE